ncbi:MAG: hypothetical protein ABSB42_01250 [Tepidisphaeraceae bacterium]|jgi:hypothetical protein
MDMKKVMEEEHRLDTEEHRPLYEKWIELGNSAKDFKTGFGKFLSDLSGEKIEALAKGYHDAQIEQLNAADSCKEAGNQEGARRAKGAAKRYQQRSDSYLKFRK